MTNSASTDDLLQVIRHSDDPEERSAAIRELEARGLVDPMGNYSQVIVAPATSKQKASSRPVLKWVGVVIATLAGCMCLWLIMIIGLGEIFSTSSSKLFKPKATYTPSAHVQFEQGKTFLQLEEYEYAEESFTKAIELDPSHARAYLGRGMEYVGLEKLAMAVVDFEDAIDIDPEDHVVLNNIAWIYVYDLDIRYKTALEYSLQAVELEPNSHNHDTLALVYFKLDQYEEAMFHYDEALTLSPNQAISYKGRGDALMELGNYQEALSDYHMYLSLDPNGPHHEEVAEKIRLLSDQ